MSTVMSTKVLRRYLQANSILARTTPTNNQILPVAIVNTPIGVAIWGQNREGDYTDPLTLERLEHILGVTPTTMSTHMNYLGDRYREDKPGLGLVETAINPLNRRQKIFKLTPKGRTLMTQPVAILNGDADGGFQT